MRDAPNNFLAFLIVCSSAGRGRTRGNPASCSVVVWDGMRPDFVDPSRILRGLKLAREGITFRNHHAVLSEFATL